MTRWLPRAGAVVALGVPTAGLALGLLGAPLGIAMHRTTALSFGLSGVALLLLPLSHRVSVRRTVRLLVALVLAMAAAALGEYAFPPLAGPMRWLAGGASGGHAMAPMTAVAFLLLGTALLLAPGRRVVPVVTGLNVTVTVFAGLGIIARLYAIEPPYGLASSMVMSVQASLAFLGCSAALLAAAPPPRLAALMAPGSTGGPVVRRLLVTGVVVPLLLGWLRLLGERAGWYETGFGTALFAVLTILLFSVVVWRNAILLEERAELQRATEERLQALWEANLIGIVVGRVGGELVDANPAFCQLLGYTRDELLGHGVTWRALTPAEYHPSDQEALAQLRTSGVAAPREKEYLRKDGSRVPVLVGVTTIRGAPDTSVAFVLDLTERRQLEDQLRQSQRLEVIGRLAGGVAHDFNNLLTPILGYAEMLLERFPPDDPARADVLEIQRAGHRAEQLTRQLLAFGRKQVLQPTIVDLNDLISDAARLVRRLIGEDITLVLALAPNLRTVRVDVSQIGQVLMNLAANARDAMPRGGTLTIETANVNLAADYAATHAEVTPGPHVLMAVHDTGVGMDRETQSRIFEPFFTTKAVGRGTGLGLATVHGIVNQSKGHIWVYSEPGRGTTFKLYFPAVSGSPEPPRLTAPGTAVGHGHETILLVEDDDALREMSARVLRNLGYTVIEARDGSTALLASKHHAGRIDLLLTDVIMPGLSGPDLAQQLLSERPSLRILYMSGYTDDTVLQHGVREQGLQFLEKPFTPVGLGQRVRSVLDAGRRRA
ncbi:MAG: PAS domain S-box protein [Acidobacteriota bacterium]|nr:PAS domain S-box protein [Acidobacteriota bacterium]